MMNPTISSHDTQGKYRTRGGCSVCASFFHAKISTPLLADSLHLALRLLPAGR